MMNRQEVSAFAGKLKREFAQSHPEGKLRQGHVLDAIAQALSYRDWNAASAALGKQGALATPSLSDLSAQVRRLLALDPPPVEEGYPLTRLTDRYLPTSGLILCGGPDSLLVARRIAAAARAQLFQVIDFEQEGDAPTNTGDADVWLVSVDDEDGLYLASRAPADVLVIGVTAGDARSGLIEERILRLVTTRSPSAPHLEPFGQSLPVAALLHGDRVVDMSLRVCRRLAGDLLATLSIEARTWWRTFRQQGEPRLILSLGSLAEEAALSLADHARADYAQSLAPGVFALIGPRSHAVQNMLRHDPSLVVSISEDPELLKTAFYAALSGHSAIVAYQSGCFPGVLEALLTKSRLPAWSAISDAEAALGAVLVNGHLAWTREVGGPLPVMDEFGRRR